MTEEEAFKLLAVENLKGFQLTLTVDDIPSYDSTSLVCNRIVEWWNGLDQFTRGVISDFDLSDGLWNAGSMYEWPGLYVLMHGNPYGRFSNILSDIILCMRNANERAADYAAQHAVGRLADDPGALRANRGS